MAYIFENFNAQSFEHFSQSICIPILGPGTIIFGSGADGAREAVYEGEVPFPSSVDRWNGYIVAQAKCREKPKHDIRDARWLAQQIESDLSKFLDENRGLRKPEYYLVFTNVFLSSIPEIGGKAVVEEKLRAYQVALGLKGFHVFGGDELSAILDNHPALRQSYTAWITPSDVLAALLDSLKRPNLSKLLPLALARDLRNDRDARLRDAGQETEKPVFLDQVFVDLPVEAINPIFQPISTESAQSNDVSDDEDYQYENQSEDGSVRYKIVQQLIRRAADKLDPESIRHQDNKKRSRSSNRNRIVVMGGPGQGKSTIGQFVSQYFRARILQATTSISIASSAREIIRPVIRRAEAESISIQGPCRFPLRIDLPSFADALKKASESESDLTVMTHISKILQKSMSINIDVDDVREWLATCPSVIIFDGLDEVPETSNRSDVIREIDALWDEVYLHNMDVLAIVTSRPQGYNKALSERHWEHWEMVSLSSEEATKYATQLANVRLSDIERRKSILFELQRAFADPTTRLLSTSPLQVAILFGIANLKGAIPQDRWELFHRYYTLLRDREAQKPGISSAIIRDFKREIDALHYECGFILQTAAELAGGNRAFLTPDQFRKIISRILTDDGHEAGEIDSIVNQLMKFATNRLVLLSSRVQNEISFDVRSLQEYMAAAQITGASPVSIIERLRTIAGSSHWRHVFRIASSRIFSSADLSYLRNDVIAVCHALDNGDLGDSERIVRSGAKLSVDLLLDGIALSAPKLRKNLVRRALASMDLGPSGVSNKFDIFLDSSTEETFKLEIKDRLHQRSSLAAYGAMRLCAHLYHQNSNFVDEILAQSGSHDGNLLLRSFIHVEFETWSEFLTKILKKAQVEVGPEYALDFANRIARRRDRTPRIVEDRKYEKYLIAPPGYIESSRYSDQKLNVYKTLPFVMDDSGRITSIRLVELASRGYFRLPSEVGDDEAHWLGFSAISEFCSNASAGSLAKAYQILSQSKHEKNMVSIATPWPIASVIQDMNDKDSANLSYGDIASGIFADFNQWKEAEERWFRDGVTLDDFMTWKDGFYLNKNISRIGLASPTIISQAVSRRRKIIPIDLTEFEACVQAIPSVGKKLAVIEVVVRSLVTREGNVNTENLINLLFDTIPRHLEYDYARLPYIVRMLSRASMFWQNDKALDFMDRMGRLGSERFWNPNTDEIFMALRRNPERRGLLYYVIGRQHIAGNRFVVGSDSYPIDELKDAGAFSFRDDDSESIRRAITALQFQSGYHDIRDVPTLSSRLVSILDHIDASEIRNMLSKFTDQHGVQSVLLAMAERADKSDFGSYAEILAAIQSEMNATSSKIGTVTECKRLELPNLAFC